MRTTSARWWCWAPPSPTAASTPAQPRTWPGRSPARRSWWCGQVWLAGPPALGDRARVPGLPPASAFPSPSPARCRCRHGGGCAAQGATPDRLLRRARGDWEVRSRQHGGQRGTLGATGTGGLEPGCTLGLCPSGLSSMVRQILMCWGCSQPSLDALVPAQGGKPAQSQA